MHRLGKPLHIWLLPSIPMFIAFFGKSRTVCEACCDWKSLHCAGRIGQKISLHHAIRQGEIGILFGPSQAQKSLLQATCAPGYHANSALANVGIDKSQRSRSCFRQKNCGRRDQVHVGIYNEVLSFCCTVMTTFPLACPSSRYRIASGTSRNG